jgi:signal transduction histidine kinase
MREIAQHILDIAENSIAAGAKAIAVSVIADEKNKKLSVTVEDNGSGMDEKLLTRSTSPFTTTRTTRNVGFGIPLFKAGAEATGGTFGIESKVGEGTRVCAEYALEHIDRPPLGDLAAVLSSLALTNPEIDFTFRAAFRGKSFTCTMAEIKNTLGGVPLNTPEVSLWLIEYLKEGIDEIFGGRI